LINVGREITASLDGKYSASITRGTLPSGKEESVVILPHTDSKSGLHNILKRKLMLIIFRIKGSTNSYLFLKKVINSTNSAKSKVPLLSTSYFLNSTFTVAAAK
jgi:hypothetical protein